MKAPFFSIVVPIYNCEKYLDKCIKSVLNQTCVDWELILVNDGSTDRSLEICQTFSRQYSDLRINVIDKVNGGVSEARNVGLDAATGNYIVFLDSDDWIDDVNALTYVRNVASQEDIDCFLGMFQSIFETENAIPIFTEKMSADRVNGRSQVEVLQYLHHLRFILTVWRLIVKREVIVNSGVRFEKGLIHEDELFASLLLVHCKTFHLIPGRFYAYRFRDGSITTSKTIFNYECYIQIALYQMQAASKIEDEEVSKFLLRCCAENLGMAKGGTEYWAKSLWLIPEGRKFLGLKELM